MAAVNISLVFLLCCRKILEAFAGCEKCLQKSDRSMPRTFRLRNGIYTKIYNSLTHLKDFIRGRKFEYRTTFYIVSYHLTWLYPFTLYYCVVYNCTILQYILCILVNIAFCCILLYCIVWYRHCVMQIEKMCFKWRGNHGTDWACPQYRKKTADPNCGATYVSVCQVPSTRI